MVGHKSAGSIPATVLNTLEKELTAVHAPKCAPRDLAPTGGRGRREVAFKRTDAVAIFNR